ncbi:hypothetical protein GE21DRAFT_6016 [Neurospora crassa]|uniref:Interferon-induced 6-16 n=1 Tax=Neurospora crassa (strain ATCC 24698 / 74-OR23-1A / CBS 708.71 / DSM 1257 / FGSC 987) TaxID=367110 RepID=V5INJ4_NEUCR|nr:hypothetical protein NCU16805 [Neurospora crassa OR74A]ESA42935.1 hypothetical protein NCU16805 [Neurospora crassa OR74A]KHE88650.1 hypothetical protein GE21DRAFT_6016 [Neurospora crassa]|eukprot:XP_011394400.1 hypothetical protein NCU16805 [Neurospora crassa OR74A]
MPWDEDDWDNLSWGEKLARIREWISRNRQTTGIGLTLAGATVVAAPALVTIPAVGSLAAGVQATIGNVAAGSWFASLTSTAMGGYGLAGLTTAVQSAGVCTSAAGLITAILNGNGREDDGNTDGAGPTSPKGPKDDGDGSEAEKTPRANQDGHRDKDFDEETASLDDSEASDEESFIQLR